MKVRCLVIALAFLAANASDSWGQSQRKSPPREEAKTSQQPAASDQRGTEQSPAFVKIIPSPKTAEEAEADRREREDKNKSDWWLVKLTGALALIGFLQLLVFGWQGIQLKRTVSATKEAAELGNKEFISTHRPRIAVYGLNFGGDVTKNEPVPISFRYVNSGDSDAQVTGFGTKLVRLTDAMLPSGIEFKHQEMKPPVEVPSGMHGFRLTPDTIEPGIVVASGAFGSERLVCVGYVAYRDGNGTRRQMGFCREFDSAAGRWIILQDDEYEYSY
jgi:hypothetical protein